MLQVAVAAVLQGFLEKKLVLTAAEGAQFVLAWLVAEWSVIWMARTIHESVDVDRDVDSQFVVVVPTGPISLGHVIVIGVVVAGNETVSHVPSTVVATDDNTFEFEVSLERDAEAIVLEPSHYDLVAPLAYVEVMAGDESCRALVVADRKAADERRSNFLPIGEPVRVEVERDNLYLVVRVDSSQHRDARIWVLPHGQVAFIVRHGRLLPGA